MQKGAKVVIQVEKGMASVQWKSYGVMLTVIDKDTDTEEVYGPNEQIESTILPENPTSLETEADNESSSDD